MKSERFRGNDRFTLIEVIVSLVLLAGALAVMAGLYTAGIRALNYQAQRTALDSALRSQMEILISKDQSVLADGSDTVTLDGEDFTVTWTVSDVNMDGDTGTDDGVKDVSVTLEDVTLTTRVVSHGGAVGKI